MTRLLESDSYSSTTLRVEGSNPLIHVYPMPITIAPIDWLLEAEPSWIAYRARLDLLGQSEQVSLVGSARQAMLADPKADPQGRFTLESVWTAWKDWEFGQKRTPSRWLTLPAWRILGRVETTAP